MTGAPVYLDYQATTPVDPSVREAMMPFLGEMFGNSHSNDHRDSDDACMISVFRSVLHTVTCRFPR